MAVQVRVLGPDDEHVLMNVAADVFDAPIDPRLTREFLHDPRHHIVVSIDESVVVGFASAVHYLHPDKAPQLWINEVAVAPSHQRRGLGHTMLRILFDVGRTHRCTMAWVLTDRTNTPAMALYGSLGGREGADDKGPSDATLGYSFDL
jgi:ribosomal protein S18 acetylase RimI-like enzyme